MDRSYCWSRESAGNTFIDLEQLDSVSVARNHVLVNHLDQLSMGRCFRNADSLCNFDHRERGPLDAIAVAPIGITSLYSEFYFIMST